MGHTDRLNVWTQFALARDVNDLRTLFPLLARTRIADRFVDRKLRIGVLEHDPIIGLSVAEDCVRAVRTIVGVLSAFGHHVEPGYPPAFDSLFQPFWKAMQVIGPSVRLEQVNWVSQRLGRECVAGDLTDEVLVAAEQGRSLSAEDIDAAWRSVDEAMSKVPRWWDTRFDLLVTPVMLEPAWRLGEAAPAKTGMFCAPFSYTGQPALVIPATLTADGLPVGVQIVGRIGNDEALLDLGAKLQEALGWHLRRPPINNASPTSL